MASMYIKSSTAVIGTVSDLFLSSHYFEILSGFIKCQRWKETFTLNGSVWYSFRKWHRVGHPLGFEWLIHIGTEKDQLGSS